MCPAPPPTALLLWWCRRPRARQRREQSAVVPLARQLCGVASQERHRRGAEGDAGALADDPEGVASLEAGAQRGRAVVRERRGSAHGGLPPALATRGPSRVGAVVRPTKQERRAARNRRRRQALALRDALSFPILYAHHERPTAWRIGHHAGRLFALREADYDSRPWTLKRGRRQWPGGGRPPLDHLNRW